MAIDITKSKQLLVEGKDAVVIIRQMNAYLGITDIEIQNFGGVNDLTNFLDVFTKNSNFKRVARSVGIIRDAETNASGAFQSVCTSLGKFGLSQPRNPQIKTNSVPEISVFILPDSNTAGSLESLLLRSVSTDPNFKCINEYFDCIQQQSGSLPAPIDKARVLAYLATKNPVRMMTGHAARSGYWNFQHGTYADIQAFLRNL